MGNEWREATLGEFVRLQRGHDLTAEERKPGDYPVMGSAGPNGTHGEFIAHGPGVVIGRSGASMGKVHFTPHDYWPHNTCLYVTDFLGKDPRFVFYLLGLLDLAAYNSGSAQPSLNRNYIYTKPVRFPLPAEQRAIAHILGTLDDKIELNRKQNETLEAMARALFKAWFVDFEPVRAKMEGRWQRGQSLPGLPAHLYGLFPDPLVESELGEIPEGWRFFAFNDLAQQGKGSVNPGHTPEDIFTHYSLPAFDAARAPVIELGRAIKSNKTPVPDASVLVSKLNPHIPRTWHVGKAGENAVCSTEFIVWTPKASANSAFLFCLATSQEFNSAMRQLVTGTSNSHQRVKPEQIGGIEVFASSEKAIETASEIVREPMEQVLQNRMQSQTLAQLRDTLLPKLISGELRVPDAMLAECC